MATITKLISANGLYGYAKFGNSAASHIYVGKADDKNYCSRLTFPSLYNKINAGTNEITVTAMKLFVYRTAGGATNVNVGCSDSGGWNDSSTTSAVGSVDDTSGWYEIDISALAKQVSQYKSNWFIHLSAQDEIRVRLSGTGTNNRPYLMVTWEYAASTIDSDKDSVLLGEEVIFTITPKIDGEKHTLTYTIGDASGTIAENEGDEVKWTPPVELAAETPNSDTVNAQIRMVTYDSNGNLLRTEIYYQTVTVPEGMKPVMADDVYASLNNGIKDSNDIVYGLAGRSVISFTPKINMNSAGGASLVSVTAEITGGQSIQWTSISETSDVGIFECPNAVSGVIAVEGDVYFTVTATDSRGRIGQRKQKFIFYPYSLPEITDFRVERWETVYDENEQISKAEVSDVGTRIWVNLSAKAAEVAPTGTDLNSLKWSISGLCSDGRTLSASSESTEIQLPMWDDWAIFNVEIGGNETWAFTATVTDAAGGTSYAYSTVSEAHAAFSISPDKRGFAIGMIASGTTEQPKFEVADSYKSYFYGGIYGADNIRLDKPVGGDLTISNEKFAAYNPDLTPKAYRVGSMVFLDGFLTNTETLNKSFDETVASLGELLRPAVDVSVLQQGSGQSVFWLRIYTNGNVNICRYRTGDTEVAASAGKQFPITSRWIAADAFKEE